MQIHVLEYFEKGALVSCPEKIAVKEPGGGFAFRQIERFAKNCAHLITTRSVSTRRPIPVFLPKGAQNIVADIGILYSGNAYANLDIKSPAHRLQGMLRNLDAELIVTSKQYAEVLKAIGMGEEKLLFVEEAMVDIVI